MTGKTQDIVKEDSFNSWIRGGASMMTCIAVMRTLDAVDEEEAEDMLRRLSAVVMQGSEALGYRAASGLEDFMEGLLKIQHAAARSTSDLIDELDQY